MSSKFNKGSELDKQIYKEGDSTWGLKDGFLDVEDIKDFFQIQFEIVEELLSVEDAIKIEKEFKQRAGGLLS